jgi:hypothetical protein
VFECLVRDPVCAVAARNRKLFQRAPFPVTPRKAASARRRDGEAMLSIEADETRGNDASMKELP